MIGIYKITNLVNGHAYIGQSIQIETRWHQHQNLYNWDREQRKPLYLAFKKYGLNNFSFETLEECNPNQLNQREQHWIKYYNTYKHGYNQTSEGEDFRGDNYPGHKLTKRRCNRN